MAVDDTGSSTIVLLMNMRPCNDGAHYDMDSWIKYVSDSGGPVAASIIKASGCGKWGGWVTSASRRPGVDGLRRPSGHVKTAGGIARLLVRRGAPSDVEPSVKPLYNNYSGIWHGLCGFQNLAQPQCPGTYDS